MNKQDSNLSPAKKALLEKWKGGKFKAPAIPKCPDSDPVPLSFSQQRLWFLDQLYHGSSFYNIPGALHFQGSLNVRALKQSLNEILRRHEGWRTSFVTVNGQPMQEIAPELTWELPIINLEHLSGKDWEPEVQLLATEEAKKPFNLSQLPLVRATLLRIHEREHIFLLTMHHIVSDGWSIGVFMKELALLYAAFSTGQSSPLPEPPIQYADFTVWQREKLQGEQLDTKLNYWKQQLGNELAVLRLPTDRPRPAVATFTGTKQYFTFPKPLAEALNKLCQQEEVSLYMTLLAAFNTLLYRYTEQEDILVGSPIANRNRPELEGILGFFVNTLVMRTDLSGNPSFRTLLSRVRDVTLDAYAHQDLPFEKLVEELQPERDLRFNPLFQVMFILQNAPIPVREVAGLTLRTLDVDSGTAMFDLVLSIAESEQGLTGFLEYNTDLFDSATIARWIGNFQTLLESVVADRDRRISELPILTAKEREQLLVEWNDTQSNYPQNASIHQLFEQQVEKSPDALALIDGSERITYGQLNQRANQLAHYLQKLGVTTETLVAICLERSVEMVVGVLAILKASGAYIPLDPSYPSNRLAFMLSDSQASLLLTKQELLKTLTESTALGSASASLTAKTVCLDSCQDLIVRESRENPASTSTADNLAYGLYTSGSTGTPKGVLGTHRGTVNGLNWLWKTYPPEAEEVCCHKTAISFVDSIWEIFGPLLQGLPAVIIPDSIVKDTQQFVETLARHEVTRIVLVPSLLRVILDTCSNLSENLSKLKIWIASGETLPLDLMQRFRQVMPSAKLLNFYGLSEVSANTIGYDTSLLPEKATSVFIGRPIDNTRVYVLDRHLQPTPAGIFGELYVGGAPLARSYLHRPELNQTQLIDNPFLLGTKLYKTGDLVRYLNDGNLEYLGRRDDCLKIRGFRVELGEIEAAIAKHPDIKETVVIARDDARGDKRLVAYVACDPQNPTASGLPQTELQVEQLSEWEKLWDETYNQSSVPQDLTLNFASWNSSYTSQPIPPEEMRDWVNYTTERILEGNPTRVLEIGCGLGLLLFRVAPHCHKYWGTDFSPTALNYLREQLPTLEKPLQQVTLYQKNADDFEGIDRKSFNAVIINSVVQYFPSINYLLRVLEGAVKTVDPGGFIFVGDLRSLPLLKAFHLSVELYEARDELTKPELQKRLDKRLEREKEMLIDPAFFIALKQHVPEISDVRIQLKRGRHTDNEVTNYRYDAILHVGAAGDRANVSWMDWQKQMLTLSSVRQLLERDRPEFLGLTRVPNARILADTKALEWLAGDNNSETVGDLRLALRSFEGRGLDPEDFWNLGRDLSYAVEITWIGCELSGSYNVLFKRDRAALVKFPGENARARPWHTYANNPLQGKMASNFIPQLRSYLQENLPGYMVPSSFITLDEIPLAPNGKVDKRSLPSDDLLRSKATESFVAPRDVWELALAQIWENLLAISPIGVTDNFFHLGGHSLLAVRLMAQLQNRFGQNFPLSTLFDNPTIESLAKIIRKQIGSSLGSGSPLVAIRSSGSRTPFFCIHPAGGNIITYPKLASKLHAEQPFYALEQIPIQQDPDIISVEETAASYLEEIRGVQPEGPYLLGGWCYGGVVAFEMAKQLKKQGEKVDFLAVIDAILPEIRIQPTAEDDAKFLVRLAEFIKYFFGMDLSISYNEVRQLGPDEQFKLLMNKANIISEVEIEHLLRHKKLFKTHVQALRDYVPQVYPDEITLFRAREEIPHDFQSPELYSDDPLLGWGKYCEQPIKAIEVPGNHFSMFVEPHIQVLAQQLKHCLNEARRP